MDNVLMKFYQESLRECQKEIDKIHDELEAAQGYSIEYNELKDLYYVCDYEHEEGKTIIFEAVSNEQARKFVFNRAISKLLLS